jgi:4-hydroxybenzoyl-CoA thioesterase
MANRYPYALAHGLQQAFAGPAPRRFSRTRRVYAGHGEGEGGAFYPDYGILLGELVQQWFEEALGVRYGELAALHRVALPPVRLECDFVAASRPGESLRFELTLVRIGNRSLDLLVRCLGREEDERARIRLVLVFVGLPGHKPVAVPPAVLRALKRWAHAGEERHQPREEAAPMLD